jgi:hypothetical protein
MLTGGQSTETAPAHESDGMIVGRIIGWLLLAAAGVALATDVRTWYHTGAWRLSSGNELWLRLDRTSLDLVQALIQRHVSTWLWNTAIQSVLQLYALVLLAVPGLLLIWIFHSREARRRRAKSSQMRAE